MSCTDSNGCLFYNLEGRDGRFYQVYGLYLGRVVSYVGDLVQCFNSFLCTILTVFILRTFDAHTLSLDTLLVHQESDVEQTVDNPR